jgi:hypothetical protein
MAESDILTPGQQAFGLYPVLGCALPADEELLNVQLRPLIGMTLINGGLVADYRPCIAPLRRGLLQFSNAVPTEFRAPFNYQALFSVA